MSRQPELYQWIDAVVTRFPTISKPQATGLALWSFGMILARSCSLTAVAGLLAPLPGQSFNSMRERLRDTYREAGAKAGGPTCRTGCHPVPGTLAGVDVGWLGGDATGHCH